MTIIDYRDGISYAYDRANLEIVRRHNSKTIRLMSFCVNRNATWAADRALKVEGYPLASISFTANRDAFRLEPGDQFKFSYPQWGIREMICRVIRIQEGDLENGEIEIQAVEDIDHIALEAFGEVDRGKAEVEVEFLDELLNVAMVDSVYHAAGDNVRLVPLAGKRAGIETGFYVYMSIDGGLSYQSINTINYYNIFGSLVEAYSRETYQIDEQTDGILIDFDVPNVEELETIQSITRVQNIAGQNIALLGSEIITFQNVTPVTTTRYRLSNIIRGRWNTTKQDHAAGTDFWYVGTTFFQNIEHTEITLGASRKFKFIPFTNKRAGELADAVEIDHTVIGAGTEPYTPGNFKANGSFTGRYTSGDDIVLTWSARVRGRGAGIGEPDTVVETTPKWDFTFEVEVFVSSVLVRTTSGIAAETWTYTDAMNVSDNGTPASEILFKIREIRVADFIESDPAEITVKEF